MAQLHETQCCGIRELDGVQDASKHQAVHDALRDWFEEDMDGAYIFFSVVQDYIHKGTALADFIKENKLGAVVKTKSTLNPNSNNMLTMWVWTINKKNAQRYYAKNISEND